MDMSETIALLDDVLRDANISAIQFLPLACVFGVVHARPIRSVELAGPLPLRVHI